MPKIRRSMRRLGAWLDRGDAILMVCFCAIIAVVLAAHLMAGWSS